jgi:hypothetical protein
MVKDNGIQVLVKVNTRGFVYVKYKRMQTRSALYNPAQTAWPLLAVIRAPSRW